MNSQKTLNKFMMWMYMFICLNVSSISSFIFHIRACMWHCCLFNVLIMKCLSGVKMLQKLSLINFNSIYMFCMFHIFQYLQLLLMSHIVYSKISYKRTKILLKKGKLLWLFKFYCTSRQKGEIKWLMDICKKPQIAAN